MVGGRGGFVQSDIRWTVDPSKYGDPETYVVRETGLVCLGGDK